MSHQEAEITFPVSCLDMRGAIATARELWALPLAQQYVIDFKPLRWVEPFGMLYFSRQLRAFSDSRKPAKCRAVNYEKQGYAAHMGFFQAFGLNVGKELGEVAGTDRYIPITELNIRGLHIEAGGSDVDVREVIEHRCAQLASVLTHNEGGAIQSTLSYSLREIFRNVVEHSRADSIWFAAQYWPTKQLVELSILDEGIGIRAGLSRNPHLSIQNDEDAIRLALLPGISGIAFEGGPRLRNDEWANSGYGLFMTSQLCARGGSFMLCSGERGILLDGNRDEAFDVAFSGTAIRLGIFVPEVQSLNAALEGLRRRGREIAGELAHAANLSASMSSRMLAKDFPSS